MRVVDGEVSREKDEGSGRSKLLKSFHAGGPGPGQISLRLTRKQGHRGDPNAKSTAADVSAA